MPRKKIKIHRKFGKKKYGLYGFYPKRQATAVARHEREAGMLARVVYNAKREQWAVYIGKK